MSKIKVEIINPCNGSTEGNKDFIEWDTKTTLGNAINDIGKIYKYIYRNSIQIFWYRFKYDEFFKFEKSYNFSINNKIQFFDLIQEILKSQCEYPDLQLFKMNIIRKIFNSSSINNNTFMADTQQPYQNLETEIIIQKDNKKINSLYVEIESSQKVDDLVKFVKENYCDDVKKWNCYDANSKQILQSGDYVVDKISKGPLIFEISDDEQILKSGDQIVNKISQEPLIFEISDDEQILLKIKVMVDELKKSSTEYKIHKSTVLEEIYDRIKDQFDIEGQKEDWTCHSIKQNNHLFDRKTIIDKSFQNDTFTINVAPNARNNLQRKLQGRKKSNDQNNEEINCKAHPTSLFQYICIEEQCSQRKLCFHCLKDQNDQSHNRKQILTLDQFVEKLKKYAKELLTQKDLYSSTKNIFKSLRIRVEQLMENYAQVLEQGFQLEDDSLNLGNQILKNLENINLWLGSNYFIDEMAFALSNKYIENRILINKINEQTILHNLSKFSTYLNEFQQQINSLDFQMLPQYKCHINLTSQSISYERKNLVRFSIEDKEYGKYLISSSDFKLIILDTFKVYTTLTYDNNAGSKLKDIGNFVQKQLKITSDFSSWKFYSQVKNDIISDQEAHVSQLIKQDVIKISIPKLTSKDVIMIDLIIDIKNGHQSKKMRQSFCERCNLLDIEDAIFNFCQIQKDYQNIGIYFKIHDQIYINDDKKEKSLFQLQLSSNSLIIAIIQKNDFQKIDLQEPYSQQFPHVYDKTIQLQCTITDGLRKQNLILKQYQSHTIADLVKYIKYHCGIDLKISSLEIFIEKEQFNSPDKRNKTFQELEIHDNQIIDVNVKWAGG